MSRGCGVCSSRRRRPPGPSGCVPVRGAPSWPSIASAVSAPTHWPTALRASALPVAPGTAEAASAHIALLVPRLRLVHTQQTACERRLDQLLAALAGGVEPEEHRDVRILQSLPGVGRVVAATMLAEASQPLATRDYQTLRAHAGVAPVTRQSGKTRLVAMRRSCNGRLRAAVFHWASNSLRLDAHTGRGWLASWGWL